MSRTRAALLLGAALAMAAYCVGTLEFGTDITRFMPDRSRSELADVSTRLTDSPLTRTMVMTIGAHELDTAIEAAGELAETLRGHPEVAWVRSAVDETQLQELYELYFPRRYYFLSDRPERELDEQFGEQALNEKARQLKRRLASPASTLLERVAGADPLGGFEAVVTRFRGGEPALRAQAGAFVTRDGRFAVVMAGSRASAFDSGAQARLLEDLERSFAAIVARHGGAAAGLELEMSGANRFAVAAEAALKRDVYWIAAFSFLGVAGLFMAFVGSLHGFLVVAVPPLAGILVATTLGLAVFGGLDGLTIAFGASLMGIAIDYSNHVLIHHGLAPPGRSPSETARRLRPSLTLGALTTVASLGGMAFTAFPAFREMSFFASTGVLAALLASLWVLPDLVSGAMPLPARSSRTAAGLVRWQEALERTPHWLLWLPWLVGGAALFALPRLHFSDDMSRLANVAPELVAEDNRVRERVAQLDSGRFVVGLAEDRPAALRLNDRIHEQLEQAVEAGDLVGMRSLHAFVWSEELQRRNWARVRGTPELSARVDRIFAEEGFRPGAFQAFGDSLEAEPPPPLTLADLEASPLGAALSPFVFDLGDRVAVVTYLRGLRAPEALRQALAPLHGVFLLDQRSFVNDVYREYRQTTLRQLLLGGIFVLLLLALRYRAWRPTLAAFLPSLVVAAFLLAGFALAGIELNLLHVMGLIMVMGMGVDYGVFLVDSAGDRQALGATLLSLLMSCVTTVFVFGTLAISSQPALRAIGLTTGLGVLLSYLLAPLIVVAIGLGGKSPGGRSPGGGRRGT